MAQESPSILMDVIVLIFLLISIAYMFFLTRGIKKIHESRGEFKQVLKELNVTIDRAEKAVFGMKNTADSVGQKLQKEIATASALVDELQFINQAGDNVARRLEKLTTTPDGVQAPKNKKEAAANTKMSKAERELAEAVAKKGKGA